MYKFDMKKMKGFLMILLAVTAMSASGCSKNGQPGSARVGNGDIDTVAAGDVSLQEESEGKVNYLTAAEFREKVMDYVEHPQEWVFEGKRPAVIDFYATWCGPCKMMSPVVEELAREYKGKIDFYKVDVDKEKELSSVFGIQSIPMFLFVPLEGKPAVQLGAMQKEEFEEIIKSVIKQ